MWKGRYIRIFGNRIFYKDAGEGPPLLCLHGWTGNSYQWRRLLPGLSRLYRVVALDLPGSGWSDKPRIEYTIEDLLLYLREFVRRLGLAPFSLMGTSFGGFLAVRYCLDRPEEVRALILLNASGIRTRYPWIFTACTLPGLRYLVPLLAMAPREARFWIGARMHPRDESRRALLREFRHATLSLRSWRGLRANLQSLRRITEKDLVDDRLAEVHCPTLLLWGDRDEVLGPEAARLYHERIPGSRLEVLRGCGHNVPEEKPAEVLDAIERFTRELREAGGGDAPLSR